MKYIDQCFSTYVLYGMLISTMWVQIAVALTPRTIECCVAYFVNVFHSFYLQVVD